MVSAFKSTRWNNQFSVGLGIVALVFIVAVLAGVGLPLTGGGLTSFITLTVVGGIGCAVSETQSAIRYRPTGWRFGRFRHHVTIIGEVLGILALVVIIGTFSGASMGFISGYTTAFPVLAGIILALFGLNLWRNVLLK